MAARSKRTSSGRKRKTTSRKNTKRVTFKKTPRALHKTGKKTATGWSKSYPKLRSTRRQMLHKCGPKCFLDSKNLKFPICGKGSCQIDCRGLRAAYKRARQYGYTALANKAKRLSDKYGCGI